MEPKLVDVNWSDIERNAKSIAHSILSNKSDNKYDCILSIGRGGMVPARLISEYLNIRDVQLVPCKSYTDINNQGEVEIGEFNFKQFEGKKVLIVDDICTTGKSLYAVFNKICDNNDEVFITTATLYYNIVCKHIPDIFGERYDGTTTWIVFPWEHEL